MAVAVVSKLHLAMKWLFDFRPAREKGGKDLLLGISHIASSVRETSAMQLARLEKMEAVMSETLATIIENRDQVRKPSFLGAYIKSFLMNADIDAPATSSSAAHENNHDDSEPEDIRTIRIFIHIVNQSLVFWKNLTENLKTLERLASEIAHHSSVEMEGESFDLLKTNVINASAGWIAIRRACDKYIKDMPSHDELKELAKKTLPAVPLDPEDFKDFAFNMDGHFQDIESMLITKDYEIQAEVAIYSSWVQPKIIVSIPRCFEMVEETTQLVQQGRVKEASKKLTRVGQHSKRITTVTEIYIRRLEALEKYGVCQQEKLMRKMATLEEEKNQKNKVIQQKQLEVEAKRVDVRHYEELKQKAEERRREAEHKKREAEDRLNEVKKWWWIPIYGQVLCVRELIENNSSTISNEERKVNECESEQNSLQGKIQSAESEISSLTNVVSNLSSQISNLKDESEKRLKDLEEMKAATATLKKSVFCWNEFTSTMDHGIKRTEAMQRIVKRASDQKDSSRILSSRGTQTTMKSFEEAFEAARRLIEEQWQYLVMYEYTCEVCRQEKQGLPMPVDEDTVVCSDCAHKFIE